MSIWKQICNRLQAIKMGGRDLIWPRENRWSIQALSFKSNESLTSPQSLPKCTHFRQESKLTYQFIQRGEVNPVNPHRQCGFHRHAPYSYFRRTFWPESRNLMVGRRSSNAHVIPLFATSVSRTERGSMGVEWMNEFLHILSYFHRTRSKPIPSTVFLTKTNTVKQDWDLCVCWHPFPSRHIGTVLIQWTISTFKFLQAQGSHAQRRTGPDSLQGYLTPFADSFPGFASVRWFACPLSLGISRDVGASHRSPSSQLQRTKTPAISSLICLIGRAAFMLGWFSTSTVLPRTQRVCICPQGHRHVKGSSKCYMQTRQFQGEIKHNL